MQRLLDFLATAINAILQKIKRVIIHTIKHPLKTMFYLIKLYFALMLLSFFVACSFGAFAAQPEYDPLDWKQARQTNDLYCSNWRPSVCAADYPSLSHKLAPIYIEAALRLEQNDAKTRTQMTPINNEDGLPTRYRWERQAFQPAFGGWYRIGDGNARIPQEYTIQKGGQWVCPPIELVNENNPNDLLLATYTIGPINVNRCHREKQPDNNCFKDPRFNIANQFHIDGQNAHKPSVCVTHDDGQICPYKGDGTGIFRPDTSPTNSCKPQDATEPFKRPTPPKKCDDLGNGLKFCFEDPNEKCTRTASGTMNCGTSCGYVNDHFACFENPDEPSLNDPKLKPRPEPDDNISNPETKMPDISKQDLKQIQRGVETRIDRLSVDMQNTMETISAAAKNDQKNDAISNRLLNNIDQNTQNTVGELQKLNDAVANIAGDTGEIGSIEKPEFEQKNDWEGRNFGTVIKENGDKLMQIPMMKSIDSFFEVSFSGTCPVYNVSVWVFDITIDQFCSADVQALFPYIRAIVLLMFSFLAIRIALL